MDGTTDLHNKRLDEAHIAELACPPPVSGVSQVNAFHRFPGLGKLWLVFGQRKFHIRDLYRLLRLML